MEILAHRGYWRDKSEHNSLVAMVRAFELGFGIEIDIRDCCGELVVSHDMPRGGEMTLDGLLRLYANYPGRTTLALNIKADGLAVPIRRQLAAHGVDNYFVFDMSIPDTRSYLDEGMNVYARLSEYEPFLVFADQVKGIWMDSFILDWFGPSDIVPLLNNEMSVCAVSSELNGRDYVATWGRLLALAGQPGFKLCTDLPEAAKEVFDVSN